MTANGSPYASHTDAELDAMFSALGIESETELFDIPEAVHFDETFGIDSHSERTVRSLVDRTL